MREPGPGADGSHPIMAWPITLYYWILINENFNLVSVPPATRTLNYKWEFQFTHNLNTLLFQLKKNQSSAKLSLVEGGPGPGSSPSHPSATKYMKRFLSPTSHDRQPLSPSKEVCSLVLWSVKYCIDATRPNWWWVGSPPLLCSLPIRKTLGASPRPYSQHPAWVMTVFKLFKWPPFSAKCGQPDPRPSPQSGTGLRIIYPVSDYTRYKFYAESQVPESSIWLTSVHPESQISFLPTWLFIWRIVSKNLESWLTSWPGSQIKLS